MSKDIKHIIDSSLFNIKVSDSLKKNIVEGKGVNNRGPMFKIAIAVCLCFTLLLPVTAARIPAINSLLAIVSPQVAQMLQPVQLECEDNGIKMQVVAAMNDDETAVVFLTFNDIDEKGRVDDTLDLYNFSIKGAKGFYQELVDYNEITKTATLRMVANGGNKLNGKKVTVNVDSFLSGKESYKISLDIDLNKINSKAETIQLNVESTVGGGGRILNELKTKGAINILKPNKSIAIQEIEFIEITNVGFVNGSLHVQTKWQDSIDNHGFFYLISPNGDIIKPSNAYFDIDDNGKTTFGRRYIEYAFDTNSIDISNYSLKGEFVKNNNYTEGNWQTTFKINSVNDNIEVFNNIELENLKIDTLTISPVGIKIIGSKITEDDIDLRVELIDGWKTLFSTYESNENDKTIIKYLSNIPLKPNSIKNISINGRTIK